ncbi:hypothetical protein WISP_87059 [Willisornis vidua]|uniref:Uncharacterized protein n=1 Tax=Willisornis vidua TaxID=1566151 RepID=A0ABQ9D779_9PASS|nr:hypothetical protein WISP_87059 [Willisornis vidua]
MPDGSLRDLPLAKAVPASSCGGASGITLVRSEKKLLHNTQRGVRACERSNPSDTEVSAEIPLQPAVQTMRRQAVSCSMWRFKMEQNPTAAHEEPHAGAGGCPKDDSDPMGRPCWNSLLLAAAVAQVGRGGHAGAGLLVGLVNPWESCWSSLYLKFSILKGHMLEQFVKNCSPLEGLRLDRVMEDCFLWHKPHTGGKGVQGGRSSTDNM